jgi:molybdopterin-dependent oxidoreductase alpha subunit
MRKPKRGGGWAAIRYTLRMASRVGWWRLWKAMTTRNVCKTCALGMGGQAGGMRNEMGHWPEVCKKSLQAMVADMQKGLRAEFFHRFSIAELQSLTPRELEWCGRLTQPLRAGPGDTHYQPISWDDALDRLAGKLKSCTPDEVFFYASGRSSNEAGFLLQLFARLFGTNYVNNCSYYCHQASGVGLSGAIGTGSATVTLEDVENTELFFLIGGNPASNHPRLMRTFMNIRRKGGKIIVINPVKEIGLVSFSVPSDLWSLLFGSKIADLYVQPHIGGDIALLTGVAKILLERDRIDRAFIAGATEGFDDFARHVQATGWDEIEHGAGVERAQIEQIAEMYQHANSAVFGWTMGITHHEHGVANVQTIINLALLRGMVGRPRAGLLPIRGHSNVQGMGSVGVTPNLKQAILDNLEKYLEVSLPKTPGLDTMGCMQAAAGGRMRAAMCLGGNLFGSNPDSRFASRALANLEQVAYLSTTLNTTHAWGRAQETLILPVRARDEEPQPTTQESMFNFVRLSEGGRVRLDGPRSEVEIIAAVAGNLLGRQGAVDWHRLADHCSIRKMIAETIPGLSRLGAIDQTRTEFHIDGRILHAPRFATPSGKARFQPHPLPHLHMGADQLRLMTVRSEGQFNTVVYEEEDIYRGQERRDVILMNQADIDRLGLQRDQRVSVRSATGVMHHILVRAHDIRAGNALMYFPEANVLVPTAVDAGSKTPAFKSIVVTVQREVTRTQQVNGFRPVGEPSRSLPLVSG